MGAGARLPEGREDVRRGRFGGELEVLRRAHSTGARGTREPSPRRCQRMCGDNPERGSCRVSVGVNDISDSDDDGDDEEDDDADEEEEESEEDK